MNYAQAQADAGSWKLLINDIWNIPKGENEVRFEMECGPGFHRPLLSLKGLAVDLQGRIYGVRKMHHPKSEGYAQFGRVSIGGRKVRAFTSSKLFERPDGSLCDVAIFIISSKQAAELHR